MPDSVVSCADNGFRETNLGPPQATKADQATKLMAAKVKVTGAFLRHFLSSVVVVSGVFLLMLLTGTVVGDVQGANKNNGIVPVPNGNNCSGTTEEERRKFVSSSFGKNVLNRPVHLNSRIHRK